MHLGTIQKFSQKNFTYSFMNVQPTLILYLYFHGGKMGNEL